MNNSATLRLRSCWSLRSGHVGRDRRGREYSFTLLALSILLSLPLPSHALTLSSESEIQSGDLIRGETYSSVYYYGEDGFRYVFPNDKIYFTWYEDFNEVKWISDTSLANIQIGGNVTYKPGVKMLKINSDPTVYAVSLGGTLHAIASESVASQLYGSAWNKQIDDVADGLFGNYAMESEIELASQYDPEVEQIEAFSINEDKNLQASTLIEITESGYQSPTITIPVGTAVQWFNTTNEDRSATEWDRVWGSGTLHPGDHFSRYFNEKGTWHYYSSYGDRNTFEGAILVE